jgi:hypothetical protein
MGSPVPDDACESRPLDEFAVEKSAESVVQSRSGADGVFCFECEPQPEPTLSIARSLVDVAPAKEPHDGNRLVLQIQGQAAPALQRFALLARASGVAATKSVSAHGERLRAFSAHTWRTKPLRIDRPVVESALEHQEFNGFVVAVVLAVAVVGYGGFLAVFMRTPTDTPVTRGLHAQEPTEPLITAAPVAPVMGQRALVAASEVTRPAVVRAMATDLGRQAATTPTARTLTALWQRRDTRSLDRAFATLRRDTLAFRRCGMRMTDADRAVARCEGVVTTLAADGATSSRSAMWTIDFQRAGGRWLMTRVSTR